jgi:hypothetical protein
VSQLQFAILVSVVLAAYLINTASSRPVTDGGKFFWKLSLINVASWIVILPLPSRGHPPPQVIVGALLWLLNTPVLVTLVVALVIAFRSREEKKLFLTSAAIYLALNIILLWVVPAVLLFMTL